MSYPTAAPGLAPLRAALANGAAVIAQQNRTTPAVAINATFYAGSAREPEALPGLAYLTGLVIDRGTARRSADDIAQELDDRGVALRVSVTRHTFSLSCTCLAVDLDAVLGLVNEIARQPAFPESEVDKRRAEAITAVRQDADNTAIRATEGVLELLYGPQHPYARPAKGTPESLDSIRRQDVVEFHSRYLVPSALRVVVVGDVEPELAVDTAFKGLSDWSAVALEAESVPPPLSAGRRRCRIPMPGKVQSDIAYGFTAIRRLDPRFYACWLMNNILGEFGLGGRLADRIREEEGMAYYAFSSFNGTVGEGPLLIRAGVDPLNVSRAIDAIDREVEKLHRVGPTVAELEESRESLVGSIPRFLETNESTAEFLQNAEQFSLGLDYDRRLPAILRAVTYEEVRQACAELLDVSRASLAVAGPEVPS